MPVRVSESAKETLIRVSSQNSIKLKNLTTSPCFKDIRLRTTKPFQLEQLPLQLYHMLPASARSFAASMRGIQLRRWRYGPETPQLVDEALERERWSPAQWNKWQHERLARILHRAATKVPFYRQQWTERRSRGDRASWELLENWPLLDKQTLRKHSRAFVADDCDPKQMFHDHTSGTTGTQLDLFLNKATVRRWYALFEARCRRWYGVSRNDRWAMLGGQLVVSVRRRQPPFWVWNSGLKQLYMSSYHLAPNLIPYYLEALKRYRVQYLLGYSSSLYELAQEVIRVGMADLKMRVAISNAEPLFDYQRTVIEQAFQCPVRETYGMAEIASAGSECEAGRLHAWPEAGILETINHAGKTVHGEAGEFVCTGLLNEDMPLIRYRVGDRGALEEHATCQCGRTLPVFAAIEGRIDDTLYTTDGRRIGRLDTVFKSELPIKEAQIIQEALNLIRVRYVPSEAWTPAASPVLVEQLQSRIGNIEIVLEQVREVPRGANGKFRAVVCNLPAGQIEALRGNVSARQ